VDQANRARMAAPSSPAKPTSILDALARAGEGVALPLVRAPLEAGTVVPGLDVAPGEVMTGGGAVVEPVLAGRLAVETGTPIQAVMVEF